MITISESGLTFGEFSEDCLYHIEKSAYILTLEHVKIAEFIEYRNNPQSNNQLLIIEAKSSIPKESEQFWAEIKDKLLNSLTLLFTGALKRHPLIFDELPQNFKTLDWEMLDIKLLLVIPTIPTEYLAPITDQFRKELVTLRQIWGISPLSIVVLNADKARQYHLAMP